MTSPRFLFLRQMLQNPREVSALAPSSRWLAQAMTRGLGPSSGQVVEFGPGTGRLTAAILARGVAPRDLTLFEMNPDFVTHLRRKFPGVTVHHTGAETALHHLAGKVGAVVSGLPLLSMPTGIRRAIAAAAADILTEGGHFIQFTYGPRSPLSPDLLADLGFEMTHGPYVWANLPPAQVYLYRKTAIASPHHSVDSMGLSA
jgi:phosphatidylethanolamine/phosphatidyl-N-methylethanolamine N-methyltransferase